MKIQDALSKEGKAILNGRFAFEDRHGNFRWSDEGTLVMLDDILGDDWQPHPDKKEIRPEKAGELWEDESIERIEIEGVQWKEDCNLWIRPCGKTMKKSLEQLVGKPQMKMILEISKEENE